MILAQVQGVSNLVQGASDTINRLAGGSFRSQLRPASYRGVPFAVLSGTGQFGRRGVVHEYPFRDVAWVEDMGRMPRRFAVVGFVVGDDAIAQRDRLIAACERPDDGKSQLVHPTYGTRRVAVLTLACSERWDQGRVFEVTMTFVEQGARLYPSTVTDATQGAAAAAAGVKTATTASFITKAAQSLQGGAAVAAAGAQQASAWAAQTIQVTRDATSLFKLAVGLPGEFGRLLGQVRGADLLALAAQLPASATIHDLVGLAAGQRYAVQAAAEVLAAAGAALGPLSMGTFSDSAQALALAVRRAAPTPAEALRGLLGLAVPTAAPFAAGPALIVQQAAQAVLRRAALTALCQAVAEYRAASTDEALAVRTAVLAALDLEITSAGDGGEDGVYASLRDARTVTVQALNAAGAGLPTLQDVRTASPMPSLALAQRLYRDPDRADDLVARAAPAHPAFMPVRFKALSA